MLERIERYWRAEVRPAHAAPEPLGAAETIAIAAILLVGAWLRLRDLAHVQFAGDQVHLLLLADRIRAGHPVLIGIRSSKGVNNPPLAIYLLFLLRLALSSPRALTAATGLLNVAAIAMTWAMARRHFGVPVALASAAMFAVSAWAVSYGRVIWQQDFIPPIAVGGLWSLLAWTADRKPWGLFGAIASIAAIGQLHMVGLAGFATIAAAWLFLRPPVDRRALAAGIALTALLYLPFAIAAAGGQLTSSGGAHGVFVSWTGSTLAALGCSMTHAWASFDHPTIGPAFAERAPAMLRAAFAVVPWIAVLAALAGLAAVWPSISLSRAAPPIRTSAEPARTTLFLWVAVPAAAMLVAGIPAVPHYAIPAYPGMWILAALGLAGLARRTHPSVAAAALAFLLVFETTFVRCEQEWLATDDARAAYWPRLSDEEGVVAFLREDGALAGSELRAAPEGDARPRAGDCLDWLFARTHPAAGGDARRYLVVDVGEGGLSGPGESALRAKGARRFGQLWVCRWR